MPVGIEVLSLVEVCLPEPTVTESDPYRAANAKAAAIMASTSFPAVGLARSFQIDPLLRYGGGGPQSRWPIPWPGTTEDLAAELFQADDLLNRGGYCGPDDRCAAFHTVLCLVGSDARSQSFEGRMAGQFASLSSKRMKSRAFVPDFADCFVPNGENDVIAELGGSLSEWSRDQQQAIDALRQGMRPA